MRAPRPWKSCPVFSTFSPMILLLLLPWVFGRAAASIFDQASKSRCQPIDIPLCNDIPYNMTIFPNPIFPHDHQSLHSQTDHFKPLIKTKCNPHIKFFVCSVFAPMCPDQLPQAVTSCRSVCEEVKRDCIKILQDFDLQWPAPLNCSKFPESPDLCMRPQEDNLLFSPESVRRPAKDPQQTKYPGCPVDLIDLDPTDRNGTCAFKCNHNTMFTKESKAIAQHWLFLSSTVSVVVGTVTVLTFLIDHPRFRFPERSILYIAFCYLVYAIPYVARGYLEHEETACERLRATERSFLVYGGLDNTVCVLFFLGTYYFSVAGSLWWLMLTFTWYLSAARKWVQEEIEKRATYLHLFAWGVPCLLTIVVLITQKVDASELSGVCSVGNANRTALLAFVVAPRAVVVLAGFVLILCGFTSMCREKQCFKQRGTDTTKLVKFMFKMGLFTFLYIGPAVVMLACDIYHVGVLSQWEPATVGCKQSGGADRGACRRPPQPQALFYIVNTSLSLVLGVSTAMWILSAKSVRAWHRFLCCGSCQAPNTQKYTTAVMQTPHVLQHNGSLAGSNGGGRVPLIPPSRNPPPPPPPSTSHYLPLAVMTSSANGGASVTYTGSGDQWKSSKVV